MAQAKTIAILSTKGGVGKTFLAANTAVALAKEKGRKVLLIDLDTQVVGDMAKMLDITPTKSAVDIVALLKKQIKDIKVKEFITTHSSGVDFLSGLLKPQDALHLDPQFIKQVLNLFTPQYDYVVIDTGRAFSELLISILNECNLILMVVTPDVLSIYQTKWSIDTLQFLHFPLKMVKVVLNRAESSSSISWQEVRVTLPIEIIALIPSEEKTVLQSVNRKTPVIIDSPASKVSLAIKKLVDDITLKEGLFLAHQEIDTLKLKEAVPQQTGEFWSKVGMAEPMAEPALADEKDEVIALKKRIHQRLIDELDLKKLDLKVFTDRYKTKELREKAEKMVGNLLAEEAASLISSFDVRRNLVKEIMDEALGLGALEDLIDDTEITDIMVNNKDEIYVERKGKVERSDKKFISNDQVKTIIERIIAPIGRRIDESSPMVDARLTDGSRVNAIIPPLALTGPTLTIRKFRKERFKIEELVQLKAINQPMGEFIKACVISRKNIIVSGGTGSGKTTVLNILSAFIPDNERIITIEDAAELKLHQEHWVRLESRPPNIEGKGAITIRDLFRNTLRMRPDRIIIGECRGGESLDMLQAMNTGHDGSMTTIHANSTYDVLSRLDSLILMSGVELPIRAIREMIASAIDIIVHTARLSDGTRKVMAITELAGMSDETHIILKDIFMFKQASIDNHGNILGDFQPTGYIPSFLDEIQMRGIPLSANIFKLEPKKA
ncbi:MAG: ATPase, T2SS/T4P/T4SS family [Candidatus Omnitrophica bacterium]|nr:ATPase, T2SS/T4P/T4SS family [Candidatus Omnitrophota bacterium]